MTFRKILSPLTILTLSLVDYSSAQANGFRLPEYSAAGVAKSNALVADTSRASAIAYNPAIMSLLESDSDNIFSGSLIHIQYETEVSTNNKTTQSIGESNFDIPGFFIGNRISDKLSFGLLVHSPFGLETEWPTATFSPFLGSTSLEPKLSRIKMYNANFNFSYKTNETSAINFGINRYRLLDLQFNSQASNVEGSATGYGWNIAYINKLSQDTSVGLHYRSAVQARATGTAAGVLPIVLDVTFPEMLIVGLNVNVTQHLNLELDVEHTGWSVFDNLNIRNGLNSSTVISSTNNWNDTLTYRASGQYTINKHQILFGYSYDETPQDDAHFSARIPDADRELFSIGYQYDFGSFQLETGLMLVKFKDRQINSTTTYVPKNEPNGTTAYNGNYQSDATIFSIGLNTYF